MSLVQLSIIALIAIGLIILTYYSGRVIAGAERAAEERDALTEVNGE